MLYSNSHTYAQPHDHYNDDAIFLYMYKIRFSELLLLLTFIVGTQTYNNNN